MARRAFTALIGLSALVLAFGQGEFTVRRELKEGESDSYKVTTKLVQTMTPTDPNVGAMTGGESRFEVSMVMDMKSTIGKVADDKKSAALDLLFSNIVYDFGQMAGMVPQDSLPKAMVGHGKMDDRARILEMNIPDLPAALSSSGGLSGPMMVELPEKPVKIGDTWEMSLPGAANLGAKDAKMQAKLIAVEDYEGVPAFAVELSATLPIDSDLSQAVEGQGGPTMKMLAKGTLVMKGKAHIQRSGGKTLNMDLTFDTSSRVKMPDMGIEFDATGHGSSLLKIVLPK